LVSFSRFGLFYQAKSGNPGWAHHLIRESPLSRRKML
jgi:hypothetical protein